MNPGTERPLLPHLEFFLSQQDLFFIPCRLQYTRSHWNLSFCAFGHQNKCKGWKVSINLLVQCLASWWEMILSLVYWKISQSLVTFMPYSNETWPHKEVAVPFRPHWHISRDSIQHFRELVRSSLLPWESCSFLTCLRTSFRPDFSAKTFWYDFFLV